ncbi:MAG: crossover junction endodeoxyribonuclease RuvC [Rickettsiales bacterium]|nr:crossover junction endodeoxyribonuclease RuvC [Rickettsiales bacterium]
MIIFAIDPALNKIGYAAIEILADNSIKYIESDIINASKEESLTAKLSLIINNISFLLTKIKPDHIAIEESFVNKNPASSLKLGHARGAIIATALQYSDKIFEYSPTQIKKSIAGNGRADKEQVQRMVKFMLPKAVMKHYDESDALAIALTHFYINRTESKIIANS